MRALILVPLGLVGLGCGSTPHDEPPDAMLPDASRPDASWRLADRMPRAFATDKTAVLAHPVIVPITYTNDPDIADINAFYGAYGASTAWSDEVAEYGVGAMTQGTPQDMGLKPTSATQKDLIDLMTKNLTGPTPAWGPADPNTIYAFFIPDGTTFTGAGSCCVTYDGFHNDVMVGSVDVAYSVNCSCPGEATFLGITNFQQESVTMSHEAVEAATDPHYSHVRGWTGTDDAHAAWSFTTVGELGDLCEYADTKIWTPNSSGYFVQRTWSNAAVKAGHDPCVGDPTEPYYQTVPLDPDSGFVSFRSQLDTAGGTRWAAKGTRIAVGASGTISLRVLADDNTAGPFQINVYDWNYFLGGVPDLDFGAVAGTYMPNDAASVSVHVLSADSVLGGGEAYVVETSPASGIGPTTLYYAVVLQ
jgi:hypothetical protein